MIYLVKQEKEQPKKQKKQHVWRIRLIIVMRAFTIGLAYYLVADIPGLTSSFVAIFVALLAFDLIVAMTRFSLKITHWRQLISLLLPRLSATAITLSKGLLLGAVFGSLAYLGLPVFLGAVFTIGLAYQLADKVRGNISHYVGMIAGIAVFDQIIRIPHLSPTYITDIGSIVLQLVYTTYSALFIGWICGVVIGIVTRLLLPRGFRTTISEAYDRPLTLQPFKDVLHTDENMSLVKITVDEHSPLAFKRLDETGLREQYQTTVLSIFRKDKDVIAPKGQNAIFPNDTLVLIMPTDQATVVLNLVKGSGTSEQV